MPRKTITRLILAITLLGGLLFALNIHADEPKVSESDLELFDADGDGKLSEAERELMFQATTIEVFTGRDLNAEDLRQMRRERGFGGRGGFGGRMGPRRAEMIVDRFDDDNDGKLNGEERKAAQSYIRNSRGESGSDRPSGRSAPNTTLETDLQMSRAERRTPSI